MTDSIRDIQIDLILGNTNPIIDMFNGIWDNLSIVEVDVYHNKGGEFIYYNKDNKWIFFRDDNNDFRDDNDDKFWCNYDRYWKVFESKLNYKEIQSITKLLVENSLENSIPTPTSWEFLSFKPVENALNNSISTPDSAEIYTSFDVEDALNNIL